MNSIGQLSNLNQNNLYLNNQNDDKKTEDMKNNNNNNYNNDIDSNMTDAEVDDITPLWRRSAEFILQKPELLVHVKLNNTSYIYF